MFHGPRYVLFCIFIPLSVNSSHWCLTTNSALPPKGDVGHLAAFSPRCPTLIASHTRGQRLLDGSHCLVRYTARFPHYLSPQKSLFHQAGAAAVHVKVLAMEFVLTETEAAGCRWEDCIWKQMVCKVRIHGATLLPSHRSLETSSGCYTLKLVVEIIVRSWYSSGPFSSAFDSSSAESESNLLLPRRRLYIQWTEPVDWCRFRDAH